jgi:hypothetical protein
LIKVSVKRKTLNCCFPPLLFPWMWKHWRDNLFCLFRHYRCIQYLTLFRWWTAFHKNSIMLQESRRKVQTIGLFKPSLIKTIIFLELSVAYTRLEKINEGRTFRTKPAVRLE